MAGNKGVEDTEVEWSGEQTSRESKDEKLLDGCWNGMLQSKDFFLYVKHDAWFMFSKSEIRTSWRIQAVVSGI